MCNSEFEFSFGLYILYVVKHPAPPCAVLLVLYIRLPEFRSLTRVTLLMLAVEFNCKYVILGKKASLQVCNCAGVFVWTSLLTRKSGRS